MEQEYGQGQLALPAGKVVVGEIKERSDQSHPPEVVSSFYHFKPRQFHQVEVRLMMCGWGAWVCGV